MPLSQAQKTLQALIYIKLESMEMCCLLILSAKNKLIIFTNWAWAHITQDTYLLILTCYKNNQLKHNYKMKNEELGFEKVNMNSLVSVLGHLTSLGFETQFKVTEQGLTSLKTEKIFQSDEVEVAHFYRFEGESDPDDNAILYAIVTKDGEKGTVVDAYGIYNDAKITNFMQSVRINRSK